MCNGEKYAGFVLEIRKAFMLSISPSLEELILEPS